MEKHNQYNLRKSESWPKNTQGKHKIHDKLGKIVKIY